MLDHSGKKRSERIDGIGDYPKVGLSSSGLKSCESCRTTKTPLWRGGPSGPKSLCNACGIKYRKKRREIVGLNEGEREEKKVKVKEWKSGVVGLLGIGPRRRRRLAEEEEAAFLLMALSSGLQSTLCVI